MTSRIPIQTHPKLGKDDNSSTQLLSLPSSPAVRSRIRTHYRSRTESSTSVVINSEASLTSDNDSTTDILHQDAAVWRRHLLAVVISNTTTSLSNFDDNISMSSVDTGDFNCSVSTPNVGKSYPDDLFTDAQLYHGAVILHAVGTVYMFGGLAIVCDEYFIPALEVITVRLGITEDVAGATLMAAGGSAPELFTSFIGVFVARSNVGVGTIVGSAVFNIVFVVGACSLASTHALTLSWWPLCRDVVFYCASLLCLIGSFVDQQIHWWESIKNLQSDSYLFPKRFPHGLDQ